MTSMATILTFILYLIAIIFFFSWMLQILKLTRQNRIINSMILKVMLEKMKHDKIEIDIEKIRDEVIKNL